MTGPEHYRRAEVLAEEAYRHLGQGADQFPAAEAWAAVAQVHATLAHAAAEAVSDDSLMDTQAWREVAGTKADDTDAPP
jgi:hypothetical protein